MAKKRTLVSQYGVVLRCDVIRKIVVENESEKTIEQSQVDLLVDLREDGFHHDDTLAFAGLPNVGKIVDALAPLVDEQWWRLSVLKAT